MSGTRIELVAQDFRDCVNPHIRGYETWAVVSKEVCIEGPNTDLRFNHLSEPDQPQKESFLNILP